ncbi:TrkH family potassium uptake protein [Endothiovibrio diazotrophicus]
MQFSLALRIFGVLLMISGVSLLPSLLMSVIDQEGLWHQYAAMVAFAVGATALIELFLRGRGAQPRLSNRDGFLIVAMLWFAGSLLASGPFMVFLELSPADAVFEATSAFTTTGATVMVGLDELPRSMLLYRQVLQWMGGVGVIVSAIALFPLLRIGGMQLYRAETPGPMKDEKLTPRLAHTARAIWILYGGFTAACAFAYWAAGMSVFDAIAHSLSTLSTGGFSTHDASFGYWDNPWIDAVGVVFMLVGGINFGVHYVVWRRLDLAAYFRSAEVRWFLIITLAISLLVAAALYVTGMRSDVLHALRHAIFTVVSVITSTGFGVDDFSHWPLYAPLLIIFASVVGGCAGSTAGGVKVIRLLIVSAQAKAELDRLVHPRMLRPIKIDGRVVNESVVVAVWSFLFLYIVTFGTFQLLLMLDGFDMVTAFGAVAACINNLGPGLGEVSGQFGGVSDVAKWLLSFAMLMGRLEIFTLLVLISPAFWKA